MAKRCRYHARPRGTCLASARSSPANSRLKPNRGYCWHGFCAIPKSVKPHRIAENIDIFDFQLASDEVAAIDALDTGVRGGPDPASISPATYAYKVEND